MSKEMNKMMTKITKYDMICGLFMSLIIGIVLNREVALAFLLGIFIAIVNYIITVYVTAKWLGKNNFKIIIITILRISFVTICALPYMYIFNLIIAYLVGFTFHFLVQGYCIISEKGSG